MPARTSMCHRRVHHPRLVALGATLALVAAVACGGREDVELLDGGAHDGGATDDGGTPVIPGLVELVISPGDSTAVIEDLAVIETIAYHAEGTFLDGSTRDVTDEVAWGVDNAAPGDFTTGGTWRSSNAAGGAVIVAAAANELSATADLTVLLQPVIGDPSFPPPPGAEDLFAPPATVVIGDPTASPRIVYPADAVMFPINIYRVLFQYDTGAGNDVYQIRFLSTYLDMKVYTTSDRWQADATTWGFLAVSNAGGAVTMTVSGVDVAAPQTVWQSTPIQIAFSESTVDGAIYYWSTSSEGVMKGVLSEAAPTKFYSQSPDDTCVACHTVSRDGKRMAVGYGGEKLQEVTVPDRDVVVAAGSYDAGWTTFSPDARLLLMANKGILTLIDADSGAPSGPAAGVVPLGGALATHPDWSPLGDQVAVAVCGTASNNKSVEACSIGRMSYDDGVWGEPEILVAAAGGDDNNFFPRYSPDGNWLVYVHATGKSKDQLTSELRLIPAAGGTPRTLVRPNQRVGPDDGVVALATTMPTWAPSTHAGTQWLAFSSVREYGKVVVGADQLWVVALDLTVAADVDPSYAAFWLPLQDAAERNHRAFWALDADVPCDATTEICDGFDNDCDGVVDDDCAACADSEVCFDGLDNDCNGLVDDRCIE